MVDMSRKMARLVKLSPQTELYVLTQMVLTMPCPVDRVEAFAVSPGLGEVERLKVAVNLWQQHTQAKHFLVAGTNGKEAMQSQPSMAMLKAEPIGLMRTEGVVTQVAAEHTPGQVQWLAAQIKERDIKSLAYVVSGWHLTRAYSTLIKELLKQRQDKVAVFPYAAAVPPDALIPETGATTIDMARGEAQRIGIYQEGGDVATVSEMAGYLSWLWREL